MGTNQDFMGFDFDIDYDISFYDDCNKDSKLEKKELQSLRRFEIKNAQMIANAASIELPEKGWCNTILTTQSFSQLAFIQEIDRRETITDFVSYIFTLNEQASKMLHSLITRIPNVIIVYSSFKAEASKERECYFNKVLSKYNRDGFVCKRAWSHAKLTMCKTEIGNFYILNGSGNYGANARIENYALLNDERLFEEIKNFTLTL